MEIRVYQSLEHFSASKPRYVVKIECPDTFDFAASLSVFRSIYGPRVVIVFVCV